MIKNIDHINIVVQNLELAAEFFINLGFKKIAGGNLAGSWIDEIVQLQNVEAEYIALQLNNTETKIELIKYHNPIAQFELKNNANQFGFRHIAFAVENIELEIERLKAKSVQFFSDLKIYPANGKKLVYFRGPENIILEFAEYQQA